MLVPLSISYYAYGINPEQDYFHGIGTVLGAIMVIVGLMMWLPSRASKKHRERLRNYNY